MCGARLYAVLGIARSTFNKYLAEHVEFKEAYLKGKEMAQAWWEGKGIAYMEEGNRNAFGYWKTMIDRNFGLGEAAPKTVTANQINIENLQINRIENKQQYLDMMTEVKAKTKELAMIDIDLLEVQEDSEEIKDE